MTFRRLCAESLVSVYVARGHGVNGRCDCPVINVTEACAVTEGTILSVIVICQGDGGWLSVSAICHGLEANLSVNDLV